REHVASIVEGVDRVHRLVKDLRRFTRAPVGERRPARVSEVVQQAVDLFLAAHRGHVSLALDLRPTPEQEVDPIALQQVVLNLLENAADASPPGATVALRVRPEGRGARLEVTDNGPGIPDDVKHRIFDPFFTTKEEGTGLGLSIVRRIAEAHGGRVACESGEGGPTTMTVVFP
ncbi:MAG TPA: HAMP domain-containing sensor histidine kinase, partial [Candidatus Thermoplasmatota archaeon]|nr:HAMP domain-containing sensor histidine kinase [Candidatus Thermoplasmatota archaeon]